jgi:hypothetical protein
MSKAKSFSEAAHEGADNPKDVDIFWHNLITTAFYSPAKIKSIISRLVPDNTILDIVIEASTMHVTGTIVMDDAYPFGGVSKTVSIDKAEAMGVLGRDRFDAIILELDKGLKSSSADVHKRAEIKHAIGRKQKTTTTTSTEIK